MRSLYFSAAESGYTRAQLRWGETQGRWRRVQRCVYRYGPEDPTDLDRALALVVATGGVASGALAGVLHGFDGVELAGGDVTVEASRAHRRHRVRRRPLEGQVVDMVGFACTTGRQTLVDLAAAVDDDTWEQALESALRKELTTVAEIEAAVEEMSRRRQAGVVRIRRVLARRPAGAAPTESLLETLFVQLARGVAGLDDPVRQLEIFDERGLFVARVDLCWPELGLFIELDGLHHRDQPVHDARRETAIVAATGWLVGRFSWEEVRRHPVATRRRLERLVDQARRRQLGAAS